ncbi:MAG TPA: non-canonical purine NTP pyrophosphatase [Gemmatimonadaceae bacterium]|nr:non-canonical purine NTP pyrophosphatase [Gemmatimonadaceae bacterium]
MTAREPVLLASRSAGKLRELLPMFEAAGIPVADLTAAGLPYDPAEEAIEAFDSFEENALAKARHFFRLTGRPTVADDSGLEVAVLGGAPGVRSKRWSGRDDLEGAALDAANNRRLLEQLRGATDRRARYVCIAAYVDALGELIARGEVEGRLLEAPAGAGGFGYDPYFVPAGGDGRTFAELSREEKEQLSHRGRAFAALLDDLRGSR